MITNGLRPFTLRFPSLAGQAVGIVNWGNSSAGFSADTLLHLPTIATAYARLRGREHASLGHVCHKHGLKYVKIQKTQPTELEQILKLWKADLVITSGCAMVSVNALQHLKYGGFNLHPSPLPAYRGADPIAWQVIDQVENMGVTVHRLSADYDTGDILALAEVARKKGATRHQLLEQLEGDVGYELLNEIVETLASGGELTEYKQPEQSPTPTANRLNLDKVGSTWNLSDLTPDKTWDVLKLYNQCPPRWLALKGWRRKFIWRPVEFNCSTNAVPSTAANTWNIEYKGATILLKHQAAVIKLSASKHG